MKTNILLVKGSAAETPAKAACRNAFRRGCDGLPWLAPAAGCLGLTGCQTFNYTDEDLARERRKLAEGYASGDWRNLSMGGSQLFPEHRQHLMPRAGRRRLP